MTDILLSFPTLFEAALWLIQREGTAIERSRECYLRKSGQDHWNTGVLLMEERSERKLLRETWLERQDSSAVL